MSLDQAADRTSRYAVASLVSGIAGVLGLPIVASVLAIVFGHIARREIRHGAATGGGLAAAGIVLGWAGIIISALAVLIFLMWIFSL